MMTEKVLVTGCAGFIGFHVAQRLLREGKQVLGLDNMNTYYDVTLKCARLDAVEGPARISFRKGRSGRPGRGWSDSSQKNPSTALFIWPRRREYATR